jgi:8-oxo-dGTP pyrophosphatase MutT (NUDIX family)
MLTRDWQERLERALRLDHPYLPGRAPKTLTYTGTGVSRGGVLIPFAGRDPHILLTLRSETVETHKGQVAFPGGRWDPEDGEDLARTACRETQEEVGIPTERVRVIGALPTLQTVTSGFTVHPFVGMLDGEPRDVELSNQVHEIARSFWISWNELMDPSRFEIEKLRLGNVLVPTPVFHWDGLRIWGATGAMIANLRDRVARVEAGE